LQEFIYLFIYLESRLTFNSILLPPPPEYWKKVTFKLTWQWCWGIGWEREERESAEEYEESSRGSGSAYYLILSDSFTMFSLLEVIK
jgi:hypothetical protein